MDKQFRCTIRVSPGYGFSRITVDLMSDESILPAIVEQFMVGIGVDRSHFIFEDWSIIAD